MGVVYRAVWEDDRADLADVARREFTEWINRKGIRLDPPDNGEVRDGPVTVGSVIAEAEDCRAVRLRLEEDREDQYWGTTLYVIEQSDRRWGWVDLEWTANDVYRRPPDFASPRIVRRLIGDGHASVGALRLRTDPVMISSDGIPQLREMIFDKARDLPIAVCTMALGESFDAAQDRARRAAGALAGVAIVAFVTGPAVERLNEALGPELKVFGGAVRVYLPGVDPDSPRGFRHRYVKRQQVAHRPQAAANVLAKLLFKHAAGLRPPEVFRSVLRGAFASSDDTDLEQLLEMQDEELKQLGERIQDAEDAVEMATLEQEEAESRAAALAARVRYLEEELDKAGTHLRGMPTPPAAFPAEAATLHEATDLVRAHLGAIVLPDSATADLGTLDEHPRAGVWAQKAWQTFLALNEYALKKQAGDFALDFKRANENGELGTFGVPTNWVTMHESDTTDKNPTYRAARTFPVPAEVDPAAEVYMDAHVKLQAGGRPCPRIHFHDNSSGSTGKIYVGWFGDHLENQQTN